MLTRQPRAQADVNHADDKSNTALHWAAKCGRPNDLKMLLKARGVRLDAKTNKGVTPLIYAASEGWDECVALLLEAGADRTAKTSNNRDARENAEIKMGKAGAERKPHFAKVLALLKGMPTSTSKPAAPPASAVPTVPALAPAAPAPATTAPKPSCTLPGGAAIPLTLPGVVASPAAATKPPACAAFPQLSTAPAAAVAAKPGHPFAFGGAAAAASSCLPTPSQPVGAASGPKGQHRASKPPAAAAVQPPPAQTKPHVALSADLEAILANVSSWSASGGLGGAFRGLFDSRLQRIAELNEVVKECAAKLQRCGAAADAPVGHAPPALTAYESELDAMQSTKEGINTKLEQLEGQERLLLHFVELLQRHEPGPEPLVDGLAVAPILLGEHDRFQGAAEQLEQGVLRLERRLASLQADHWSKLTDKLSQHSELVHQQALRVAALREAAAAAHGRAHASAIAASEDALQASAGAHATSSRADHEAPCLAHLRDQLRRRDARGIEPGAVVPVEEAARMGAPAAEPPPASVPAAVAQGGRRSMFATFAAGNPSSTTASAVAATATTAVAVPAMQFPSAAAGPQTSAASKSGGVLPGAGTPFEAGLFATKVSDASKLASTLGTAAVPASGGQVAAAPPAAPTSLPFSAGPVAPAPDSAKLPSLFSAAVPPPEPKPGHAPSEKPLASAATTPPPATAPAAPNSLANAAFGSKLSPSPAAKPPSRQPSGVGTGKPTDVIYATLTLDNDCPEEHRLTWYTRHKPANVAPAVLRDGAPTSAAPSSATPLDPAAASPLPQNPFAPPSTAISGAAPAPAASFGERAVRHTSHRARRASHLAACSLLTTQHHVPWQAHQRQALAPLRQLRLVSRQPLRPWLSGQCPLLHLLRPLPSARHQQLLSVRNQRVLSVR